MQVNIRPATEKDISFIAWAMFTAARSHLTECPWCTIFCESETQTLSLLERTIQLPELYWSYISNFWVAEVNGVPAAAMCAFAPSNEKTQDLASVQLSILRPESAYSKEHCLEVSRRLAVASLGLPDELLDVWGVESVAVVPEFRGKGVADLLFRHVLQEGRKRGFKRAQIMCLLGNEQAQRAFERNGFNVVSQKTNNEFEALFGTAGAKLLVQEL